MCHLKFPARCVWVSTDRGRPAINSFLFHHLHHWSLVFLKELGSLTKNGYLHCPPKPPTFTFLITRDVYLQLAAGQGSWQVFCGYLFFFIVYYLFRLIENWFREEQTNDWPVNVRHNGFVPHWIGNWRSFFCLCRFVFHFPAGTTSGECPRWIIDAHWSKTRLHSTVFLNVCYSDLWHSHQTDIPAVFSRLAGI